MATSENPCQNNEKKNNLIQRFAQLKRRREQISKCEHELSGPDDDHVISSHRRPKRKKCKVEDIISSSSSGGSVVQTPGPSAIVSETCQDEEHSLGLSVNKEAEKTVDEVAETESQWETLKSYIDVNKHISDIDWGKDNPKCGLEKRLDEAIAAGDFDLAEQISDHLSTRDFGVRISEAAKARDYVAEKKAKQAHLKAKKKKKLQWGMEPKERWEMKSNM